jgi:hypothetical protein
MMKYLRGMGTLPLILSANGTGILKSWVEAAFAVHPNMRRHSGGGLSLGRGFPIVSSTKLNTHAGKPTKNKELKPSRGKSTINSLVPSKEQGRHHWSVLGEVTWMKGRCSKNLTRTRNISPKGNKQGTSKQQTQFSFTSIN